MKFGNQNKKFKPKFGSKGKASSFQPKAKVKTRKELRKEDRQRKKNDRINSYNNRIKSYKGNQKTVVAGSKNVEKGEPTVSENKSKHGKANKIDSAGKKAVNPILTDLSKDNRESKRNQQILEKQMKKQRLNALKAANEEEDKVINNLEKQLGLNRRKSKSLPASFVTSGLDYILDACNPDKMKSIADTEKYLHDSGSEFEDDLATIKGKPSQSNKLKKPSTKKIESLNSEESSNDFDDSDYSDDDVIPTLGKNSSALDEESFDNYDEESSDNGSFDDTQGIESDESDLSVSQDEITLKNTHFNSKKLNSLNKAKVRRRNSDNSDIESAVEEPVMKKSKKAVKMVDLPLENASDEESKGAFVKIKPSKTDEDSGDSDDGNDESSSEENADDESKLEKRDGETWEDIYGRTRDKEGNVLEVDKGKYVPPALRAKALGEDAKKREVLERLKRQLKGWLNRLAESNMHSIASQIEELYMKNSRNDMNQTMIDLFTEAIVSPVHTPERLIMEYAMLTAILHANIGTEVGAYILQSFVTNFDKLLNEGADIGDKRLDNLLAFICHLYTFRVFDNGLLYDILGVLCDTFKEKEIDLILVVLRNSGFSLRKDDPLALKELVLKTQRLASQAAQLKNDSRVNFMLDVLLKIKNNNMSKLPQYDPSHSEHLKKIIKTLIRKGNSVTELKISLKDLLQADERGRWWVVGSAWSGHAGEGPSAASGVEQAALPSMSSQLAQLAKKLRINTDIRKNIFCILMTAEDYNDAFEKLLKLGLKGQTVNEIIHVLLHCLVQEKVYNHYYALIANRFAQADRKYRMVVQYSLWDKFKEVESMKPFQVTNLAKFLAFLFIEGTLPLSVLKVIQLVEMTKGSLRLIRQTLLSILYHKDEATCANVFLRLSKSSKLHLFREGLRLFLHHFLLKNMKESDQDHDFLKRRVTLADTSLQSQTF